MVLDTILRWAIPFACGGVVAWCVTYIKMRKARETALENGVQCLLRAEIIRNHDKYVIRHFCPIYAKEALRRAYNAYHALGGNDVATRLYEEVMELPTEDPNAINMQ